MLSHDVRNVYLLKNDNLLINLKDFIKKILLWVKNVLHMCKTFLNENLETPEMLLIISMRSNPTNFSEQSGLQNHLITGKFENLNFFSPVSFKKSKFLGSSFVFGYHL